MLVLGKDRTDETARLYDAPVTEETYHHIKGIRQVPGNKWERSGYGYTLVLPYNSDVVGAHFHSSYGGPRAYISEDQAAAIDLRTHIEAVFYNAHNYRAAPPNASKIAEYDYPELPESIRKANRTALVKALSQLPLFIKNIIASRESQIENSLSKNGIWLMNISKEPFQNKDALIMPSPYWPRLAHESGYYWQNFRWQFWALNMRQNLAQAFVSEANEIIGDTKLRLELAPHLAEGQDLLISYEDQPRKNVRVIKYGSLAELKHHLRQLSNEKEDED